MKADKNPKIENKTKKLGLDYLGQIPYDPQVENAIGNPAKLLKTKLAEKAEQITQKIQQT